MLAYYRGEIPRAFWEALAWIFAQGLLGSLVVAFAVLVFAVIFHVLSALWRGRPVLASKAQFVELSAEFATFLGGVIVVMPFLLTTFFLLRDAADQIAAANKRADELTAKLDAINGKGLFIECHSDSMSYAVPSDGRYYLIQILDGQPDESLSEIWGPPGDKIIWAPYSSLNFAECSVTNYTSEMLFSVKFKPSLEFPKGQGKVHPTSANVGIAKLDASTDKAFNFYVLNETGSYVDVTIPNKGAAQRLGAAEAIDVTIVSNGPIRGLAPIAFAPKRD